MAILGSKRKPSFWWQALLILLPVIGMAIIGWAAMVRDRASVEQDARQHASEMLRAVASELTSGTVSRLVEFDAAGSEWFSHQRVKLVRLISGNVVGTAAMKPPEGSEYGASFRAWEGANPGIPPQEVFPNRLWLEREGRLAWPPEYEQPPRPPAWLLGLTPTQRQLWGRLQYARASADVAQVAAARTQFLKTAPDSAAKANADFVELELKSAQEEMTNAVAKLLVFAQQHPSLDSDSGIPLSSLAIATALRAAKPGMMAGSDLLPMFRLLLQYPGPLTGHLLEQARSAGSDHRAFQETARLSQDLWLAQERLRNASEILRLHRASPRDGPGKFWIELSGESWFCLETEGAPSRDDVWPFSGTNSAPFVEVRLYPKALLTSSLASVLQTTRIVIPDYATLLVTLDGVPLASPAADARNLSPKKVLTELRFPLGHPGSKQLLEGTIGPIRRIGPIGPDPGTESRFPEFHLQLDLVNTELLFARQRQRTQLFEGLILASAIAALVGLFAAYRAFRRQLRLSELKSNFVSSVSHELRAPIASVRLMAESLERGKISEPARQKEYFHFIVQECRRLASLIENVLDFSRIEQGRKQYEFEPTDLVALVRETCKLMETYAAEKKVCLALAAPALDSWSFEIQPNLDGKAIQQALINLIDNALKHSPAGETVTVGLDLSDLGAPSESKRLKSIGSGSATPRPIELWVQDNGPGIPPEEHERIFERFYRTGSELRRQTQGVGIGLSIVKHIVEAHGGRVRVRSDVDQGSRFTLELPRSLCATEGFPSGDGSIE